MVDTAPQKERTVPTKMSRKEALHLLYALSLDALRPLITSASFEEYRQRSQEVFDAYPSLLPAAYGPRKRHQLCVPCEHCRQRYAETQIDERGEQGELLTIRWLCISCSKTLPAKTQEGRS